MAAINAVNQQTAFRDIGQLPCAGRHRRGGTPAGDEFEVAPTESAQQLVPSVAMDADGDFVVAWDRFSQTSDGVFARRFLADGTPTGGEFQVNTSAPGGLYLPSVASAESGEFVVVWESDDGVGKSQILGQRFDSAGQFAGSEFTVNTTTMGNQFFPSVAMDADGDSIVVWESYGQSAGEASTATVGVIEAISSLSGSVYVDANNDGLKDLGEAGIAGVPVTLSGVNDLQEPVDVATTTAADGSYEFTKLRPGIYTLSEDPADGFLDGQESLGSLGGLIEQDRFSQIVVPAGGEGTGYDFGELIPAGLSGSVYVDANNDGLKDLGETAIAGVPITLSGVNDLQEPVDVATTTAADGSYEFTELRPGIYTLSEDPADGFLDGQESLGSLGGVIGQDGFSQIVVPPGGEGTGYAAGAER